MYFLSRVSTLTRDIDIEILSVCPSVTRWYCISKRLNILSCFLHHTIDHSFWFCVYTTSLRNSDGVTPATCGGAIGRVWKCRNFRPITCYISEMVEGIDGYMQRGVFQALNSHSNRVTFIAIVPGGTQEEMPKCLLDSILRYAICIHPQNGWRQRHTGVTLLR